MLSYGTVARLVTPRRLRAMSLAVRHDVQAVELPEEAAPDLVDLVTDPYESIDDARDRLEQLERLLRRRDDRRAVFLTIYTNMTRAVEEGVERGTFADPAWMRAYTRTFANYYREAFLAFEQGRPGGVPDPWRLAFGTAVARDALVAQDAFLGINAHINYDLALTLRDVGVDPNRKKRHLDHQAINEILARLVDAQQEALAELYAPGIDDVDATLGQFDETLSTFVMREAREQAWRVGVVLCEFDWRPVETYVQWVLRTTATGGAVFALSPTLSPDLMHALERVERERLDLEDVLDTFDSKCGAVV